jgi:tRNA A37 threonylcarbamoyladenosine dehydratase
VALALGRLGVARIILVDFDTYDASNLTRQCLGTPDQV